MEFRVNGISVDRNREVSTPTCEAKRTGTWACLLRCGLLSFVLSQSKGLPQRSVEFRRKISCDSGLNSVIPTGREDLRDAASRGSAYAMHPYGTGGSFMIYLAKQDRFAR